MELLPLQIIKVKKITIKVNFTDSLKDIVKNINEATTEPDGDNAGKKIGITATIIDGRIVLNDEKTGARNITLEGDILGDLRLNTEQKIGQQAKFTINGVEVTRDSNRVSDVIEGVTINLNKEHGTGEYDTVTVKLDTEKVTKAVQDL